MIISSIAVHERFALQEQPNRLALFINFLFSLAVYHAVRSVHHSQYLRLIRTVNWCNRDISYSSKLSAVVQMFIFQTEKIPHEAPIEQTL